MLLKFVEKYRGVYFLNDDLTEKINTGYIC